MDFRNVGIRDDSRELDLPDSDGQPLKISPRMSTVFGLPFRDPTEWCASRVASCKALTPSARIRFVIER